MNIRDQSKEDLKSVCFNVDDFGQSATWMKTGATVGTSVNGIFKESYKQETPFSSSDVANGSTVFICATADVDGIKANETMEIDEITFYVAVVKAQSAGYSIIVLSENPI